MRILLDEGVPRQLARMLRDQGFDATPFPNAWKQFSDSELLDIAEAEGMEVLITADKNMPFQQSLIGRSIAVLVIFNIDRKQNSANVIAIGHALGDLRAGHFSHLGKDGRLVSARSA